MPMVRGQRRYCPPLGVPVNGQSSGNCQKSRVNSICKFDCNYAHTLNGSSAVTCQKNGRWSAPMPTCDPRLTKRPSCPSLEPPLNGFGHGNCKNGYHTSVCSFTCSEGYELHGHNVLRCFQDGQWSSSTPRCQPGPCDGTVGISGGYTTGHCAPGVYGQSCTLSCPTGQVVQAGVDGMAETFGQSYTVMCDLTDNILMWSGHFDNLVCVNDTGNNSVGNIRRS
ncbi:P-selectin [Halotydeus destructor]|nr:P-selectin [Halotydeus destructor]